MAPQFVARAFEVILRITDMTHVRTAPYHPQSGGKIERWHRTLEATAIRPHSPNSVEAVRHLVTQFVAHHNGAASADGCRSCTTRWPPVGVRLRPRAEVGSMYYLDPQPSSVLAQPLQ